MNQRTRTRRILQISLAGLIAATGLTSRSNPATAPSTRSAPLTLESCPAPDSGHHGAKPLSPGMAAMLAAAHAQPETTAEADRVTAAGTCIECHTGIEEIHPGFQLSCVDCHGGNSSAKTKAKAHILPAQPVPNDERVLPEKYDLPYQRFKNPSNLRVAQAACGECHEKAIDDLLKSPHGTTAGHLGDGFYENGLVKTKRPTYSIFPVRDTDGEIPKHAIAATTQVPPFRSGGKKDRIETHYSDLARKACMQCHLYSEGRGVDGRVAFDGDYRGEGCAACHVAYAEDGRTQSGDKAAQKSEPGHPLKHRFTSKIKTQTCVTCHYGDASIGLHFRGLAQLVPGMQGGPQVQGTTDSLLNRQFYIRDDKLTPPDIHHQKGMHCIDCHTLKDVMGDGNIYPQMDFAVEIECSSCHGDFKRVSALTTSKGRRISNLSREGDAFYLTSKVTGKKHKVTQVKNVIDPKHPDYNARGAAAMNSSHGRLECYTCHNGWNVNFFGFHFDRNEQFTQLDLISGKRTPGRVTTQEKVFATFNQLRLGFNHEGKIAPYLVGFSTIGSAHDKNGKNILHQATPETAAGLSGVTMVPHQMHTTRARTRSCTECHRSPATYGMGSPNFRLTREYGFAVSAGGFHSVALDTRDPGNTRAVGILPIAGTPAALGVRLDPVHARATHAYVGCEDGTLAVVNLNNPVMPRLGKTKKLLADPQDLVVQGGYLYVADGVGGVLIFDIESPNNPKLLGALPTTDARDLEISYPWMCIADGSGGLLTADISDPKNPKFLAAVDLNGESARPNEAFDVKLFFQYSRIRSARRGSIQRTRARHLAMVACGQDGARILDVTEPSKPVTVAGGKAFRFNRGDVRGVAINTVFDIGSAGGGLKSGERDYLYVFAEIGPQTNRQQRIYVYDVSDPQRPKQIGGRPRVFGGTGKLEMFRAYNAPFLQHFIVSPGAGGVGTLVNVSKNQTGATVEKIWGGVNGLRDMEFEEFAFDRLQDERGRMIKDISHNGCRYLTPKELQRVLGAKIPVGNYELGRYGGVLPKVKRRRRNK